MQHSSINAILTIQYVLIDFKFIFLQHLNSFKLFVQQQ